ncbi:MAG: biopolymer transporter ExbD [Spirochaetes bacterium]|nr:biopolymer transporter ExbD [Spirochaetota bacterium]
MSTERLNIDRRKKVAINLNIAPLIDVVFQLLLFFALTSYFVANPGIEIALPKAESAVTVQKDNVIIYITANKEIFCGDSIVELSHLKTKLLSMPSSKTVIVKADKTVELGFVVGVIDIIKQTAINNLIIATTMEKNNDTQK